MELGEKLGRHLSSGTIMAFRGGLGAGKTTFVKGLARGLGIGENVTSPTFPIVSEYTGRLKLYHIDLYRINGEEEISDLGLSELFDSSGISVIEWSEKMRLPEEAVIIDIEMISAHERRFTFNGIDI